MVPQPSLDAGCPVRRRQPHLQTHRPLGRETRQWGDALWGRGQRGPEGSPKAMQGALEGAILLEVLPGRVQQGAQDEEAGKGITAQGTMQAEELSLLRAKVARTGAIY